MSRLRQAFALTIAIATLLVAAPMPAAHADGPTVLVAGSTWVGNAIQRWAAGVSKLGLHVNYNPVGSSAGRQFFQLGQVDFAATEVPYQGSEPKPGIPFNYLPDVAGGTSLMYNLKDGAGGRITDLQLSAASVAAIFTGTATYWDDPVIKADNPGKALPHTQLTPVYRSDGSGTSAQLGLFLKSQAPGPWAAFQRQYQFNDSEALSNWPPIAGQAANGSDGVAAAVANDTANGLITYVETSYAKERGFPVALLKNAAGRYTVPTAANVSVALTKATLNADRTQNLQAVYTNPDPNAYAMSSYSYLVVPTGGGFDPAKGNVIARFIYYAVCKGQQGMDTLGYAPMPRNLVQVAFDAAKAIPGAPAPPALQNCANPLVNPAAGDDPLGGAAAAARGAGAKTGTGGGTGANGSTGTGSTGTGSGSGTTDCTTTTTAAPAETTSTTKGRKNGSADAANSETTTTAVADPCAGGGTLIDPATGLPVSGGTGVLATGPAASVKLEGANSSPWPLVLAGIGLVLLVIVPPAFAGVYRRKKLAPAAADADDSDPPPV